MKNYNDSYSQWKDWDPSNFAVLDTIKNHSYNAELKRIGIDLNKKIHVLEIGFGNGTFLRYSKNKNWDIEGVEANQDLINLANNFGFKAKHTKHMDSFKKNFFDLIVAFDVLEHLDHDSIINLLNTTSKLVKSDGIFLARFPNGDSPFSMPYQNGDATHLSYLGSGKIKYYAQKVNAKVFLIAGEIQPIFIPNFFLFLHRLIAVPVKKIINLIVQILFFPKSSISFTSANLVVAFKFKKD